MHFPLSRRIASRAQHALGAHFSRSGGVSGHEGGRKVDGWIGQNVGGTGRAELVTRITINTPLFRQSRLGPEPARPGPASSGSQIPVPVNERFGARALQVFKAQTRFTKSGAQLVNIVPSWSRVGHGRIRPKSGQIDLAKFMAQAICTILCRDSTKSAGNSPWPFGPKGDAPFSSVADFGEEVVLRSSCPIWRIESGPRTKSRRRQN